MARSNEGENPLFRRLSAHGIGPLTMLQLDKTLNERGLRFKE
jgi:hypothetical protein